MTSYPEAANSLSTLFAQAGAIALPDLSPVLGTLLSGGAAGIGLPLFAFAIAISPGPSNVVLLTTGAGSGARRGLPLLIGMAFGYAALWGAGASGLRFVAALDPTIMRLVQGVALALIAVIAFKLVTASDRSDPSGKCDPTMQGVRVTAPGGFGYGLAFQFVNPKAWVSALAAAALFCTPEIDVPGHAAHFGGVAFVAVLLGCGLWLWAGAGMGDVLRRPALRRATNGLLVVMLIGSAVPLVLG